MKCAIESSASVGRRYSGAQGHRKYSNTFFAWIGAAVEIPPRVWKLLGSLGHKLYFFRPYPTFVTDAELLQIARSDSFQQRLEEVEQALYDHFASFDAAPDGGRIRIDAEGIVKVRWNNGTDQHGNAWDWITKLSRLIAHLRGSVYLSEGRAYDRKTDGKEDANGSERKSHAIHYTEDLDYDNGIPIIENPTRAVTILRNLAVAHAISQGRDTISLVDIPMIIRVVLSTTTIGRSKVFELLIKHDGSLTTSMICNELGVSSPTAKRAMRELHALKMVDISTVAGYSNAELMITVRDQFKWIKDNEFKELWNKSNCKIKGEPEEQDQVSNDKAQASEAVEKATDHTSKEEPEVFGDPSPKDAEECDIHSCHTTKANPPPGTLEKNSNCPEEYDTGSISSSEDYSKKAAINLNDSE